MPARPWRKDAADPYGCNDMHPTISANLVASTQQAVQGFEAAFRLS